MKNDQPGNRVCVNGRECRVEYIQLWGSDWFDISLWDANTGKFVDSCTSYDPSVPLATQQVLVRPEYVAVLADAGIVRRTGEVIASKRYGNLSKCHVPNGPTHLAWEGDDSPRKLAVREHLDSPVIEEPDLDLER